MERERPRESEKEARKRERAREICKLVRTNDREVAKTRQIPSKTNIINDKNNQASRK